MTVGFLGIPNALGTEPLIVSLSIAGSDAMMRPIMLPSTTSRNSNCSCREPMQYFCICFRASLSIHSAGWIFPFSTFITSCFSGHNTLFFLAVSGFCGLHDTIWPFKASPQPTLVLNKRPHCGRLWLRVGRYDPRAFSCFIFSPKNRPLFRRRFPDKPPVLAARPSGVHGCHSAPCAATQRPTGANTGRSTRCLQDVGRR